MKKKVPKCEVKWTEGGLTLECATPSDSDLAAKLIREQGVHIKEVEVKRLQPRKEIPGGQSTIR